MIYPNNDLPVNIIPVIRDLLLHREKVGIPGLGTFTVRHRPAELIKTTGVLLPPTKEIVFNNLEQPDDGVLTGLIASRFRLAKAEAVESVAGFVHSVEEQLKSKGTAVLGGMGNLNLDKSGKYVFKPSEELLERMVPFELPRINMPGPKPAPVPPSKPVPQPVHNIRKRRRWWIPVSLVVLLTGLSALVYFSGLYDRFGSGETGTVLTPGDKDSTDRIVFGNRTTSEKDTLQERISRELDKRTARDEALQYREDQEKPAVTKQTDEPVQEVNVLPDKPFHIIAGSFQVPENAERQKMQLEKKGLSPKILPKRGRFYMVSLGSYDSHEQATEALRQLKMKLEQELWVMQL